MAEIEIPEMVRLKAISRGATGAAWLAALGDIIAGLAADWEIAVGRTLPGGTEAFVAEVTMTDGLPAVLKIAPPGGEPIAGELATLSAARGRGYAKLLRHDEARGAMLLERLGPRLAELGLPIDAQMETICATLAEAWTQPPPGVAFTNGAEKAASLAAFIETSWRALGRPCAGRTIETALRFAELRRQGFDPASAVLAHGDAHAWNTLLVPGEATRRFKFVDPDGVFVEPAYDLSIPMREWSGELLAGDPVALGRRRCRRLAELTGVAPKPIWQWGFIERTSTGLLCLKVGLEGGRDMLAVADAWAAADTA